MRHTFIIIFAGFFLLNNQLIAQDYSTTYDGSSSYIDLGTAVGNQGIRTIEFKFNPAFDINPATPDPGYSFIVRNDGEYREYAIYIRGTDWVSVGGEGYLYFYVRYDGIQHTIKSNQSTWLAADCYHVAGVLDPVNGMQLYIDGVLQTDTDPAGTAAIMTDNVHPTHIGNWGDANIRYFEGDINDLSIWNQTLTGSQIQNHMTISPTISDPGLIAYYPFNEGSGAYAVDVTANSYDGTVFGGVTWIMADKCMAVSSGLEDEISTLIAYISPTSEKDYFNIYSDASFQSFSIINNVGQEILHKDLENGSGNFDMINYPPGIYYVHLSHSTGMYRTIKFMKER